MGVVYLAERADRQFEKQVALKAMSVEFASPELERRFLVERQILAGLVHPGIGRLLDGGVGDDGRPFLVMDLVEGEPIDHFCRASRLGLRERIGLFLQVCEAVQYAHQHMVIHRDLKPSNILVTPEGRAKLLDFGVAKSIEPANHGSDAQPVTLCQPRTLEYASPEQVTNGSVAAASDVYSLGVLLYRLLAGRPPYELGGLTPGKAERVICEETPPRVSATAAARDASASRLESVAWSAKLRGDLDNVVAKALAKEPAERYATVERLAGDLRRFLDGRPVEASAPGRWYSARKFLSRHRVGFAAVAVVALALVVGTTVALWQAARARAEAVRSGRIAEVLIGIFEDADPYAGKARTMTVPEILRRGAEKVRTQFAHDPVMLARSLGMLSAACESQGLFKQGLELAGEQVAAAKTLGEGSLAMGRARFRQAWAEKDNHQLDAAAVDYSAALEIFRRTEGARSSEAADALQGLGFIAAAKGDNAAAARYHRRALEIRRTLEPVPGSAVAVELNNLSTVLDALGRDDESIAMLEEALAIARRTVGDEHPATASMRSNLAIRKHEAGDLAGAETLYRQALAVDEKTLGSENPSLTNTLTSLGRLLIDEGRFRAATPFVERAVSISRQAWNDNDFHRIAAEINLASLRLESGRSDLALPIYRGALARIRKLVGDAHPATARTRSLLAACLRLRGDLEGAEREARRALVLQRKLPVPPLQLADSELTLGSTLVDAGRLDEAEPLLAHALQLRRKALPASSWRIAEAELQLGRLLLGAGRVEEAGPRLAAARPVLIEKLPPEDRRVLLARRIAGDAAAPGN